MVSLRLECHEADCELLSAELWEQGATGIQEEDLPGGRVRLRAWFDSGDHLENRFSSFSPQLQEEDAVDWEEVTRQAWQPVAVGSRFYLAPEWDESETPAGRLRLTVHPGMALGTGDHPATRLALSMLERHVGRGDRLLDVGTGTGILLSGAYLLGAKGFGCDIEFDSARTARYNLMQDAIPPRVFAGSLRAVASASVDIVVANINATTHQSLGAEYARVARRLVILTGFPDRHEAELQTVLAGQALSPVERLTDREWVCLALRIGAAAPLG